MMTNNRPDFDMLKKAAITVLMIACSAQLGAASMNTASLDIDIGARAAGMAGAFTAVADDASAVYYNPAGLSNIKMIEIDGAYDKWFSDSSFQYGILAIPVGYGAVGAMFTYTNFGSFTARNEFGAAIGNQIIPYNICGTLSYGAPIGDIFSAGVGVKYSSLTIDDYSAGLFLIDAGVLANLNDICSLGASLQNLDTSLSNGYNIRCGAALTVFKVQSNKMVLALDAKYWGQYGMSYAVGTELDFIKILSIRAGYDINPENRILAGISGLSVGAGLTIDKFSLDYAFTSRGDLGMTHLVGIRFLYEAAEDKEKKNYQKMTEFLAYQSYKDGEDAFNEGNYKRAQANWEDVKSMSPDYDGIDTALGKVKRLIATGGSMRKADELFNEGMKYYEDFDFDKAVKKWTEVKKMFPAYKDIDTWLGDANELKASKGMSKQAEKYFREGIKSYNNCDYNGALAYWEKGMEIDPNNKKIGQYISRTKAKQLEIKEGIQKAKADVANDTTVIEGVKRLRDISGVCPAYKDATDILSTLRDMIALKTRDYYYKGIEKYTDGNLDAAIIYWNNIEALDPKSEYLQKVRRYITDARNKQKAVKNLSNKKK
jgi:outer membrane protein assembly factor BamD (BamD/ComL family)